MATLFTKARKRLKRAAKYLDIHPDVIETLKYPKETLAASLIVLETVMLFVYLS